MTRMRLSWFDSQARASNFEQLARMRVHGVCHLAYYWRHNPESFTWIAWILSVSGTQASVNNVSCISDGFRARVEQIPGELELRAVRGSALFWATRQRKESDAEGTQASTWINRSSADQTLKMPGSSPWQRITSQKPVTLSCVAFIGDSINSMVCMLIHSSTRQPCLCLCTSWTPFRTQDATLSSVVTEYKTSSLKMCCGSSTQIFSSLGRYSPVHPQ